jgi:hypothetical protein
MVRPIGSMLHGTTQSLMGAFTTTAMFTKEHFFCPNI